MPDEAAERMIKNILAMCAGQPPGTLMPKFEALVAQYDCSPATIAKAYELMRKRGMASKIGSQNFLGGGGVTIAVAQGGKCLRGDLMESRVGIERLAVANVAQRIADGDVGLRDEIDKLLKLVEKSKQTRVIARLEEFDWEVHRGVVRLASSATVQRLWRSMEAEYQTSVRSNVRRLCRNPDYCERNDDYHQNYLSLTRHGQVELAQDTLEDHLRYAMGCYKSNELAAPLS